MASNSSVYDSPMLAPDQPSYSNGKAPSEREKLKKPIELKPLRERPLTAKLGTGTNDALVNKILELQAKLIERDAAIHTLNEHLLQTQRTETRKQELKKGLSSIEVRNVDTSTVDSVLNDSMHHLLCTAVHTYSGNAGVVLLDVPFNASIGAGNKCIRQHLRLKSYWFNKQDMTAMENINLYRDLIVQKRAKIFGVKELTDLELYNNDGMEMEVQSMLVVPVVVENTTIALLILLDGDYAVHDQQLLYDLLPEIWTSNIQSLINIALEEVRKKQTESALVEESLYRDEIILQLEKIVEDAISMSNKTSKDQWVAVLVAIANFFEGYFNSEVLVAVTNTPANEKMSSAPAIQRRGSNTSSRGVPTSDISSLAFRYYIFSSATEHIKNTKMRGFSHPALRKGTILYKALLDGVPFFSNTGEELSCPAGHMKVNRILLVPIVFMSEPVGLLGLTNGDFELQTGRILQSVFSTFWSMIVKSTVLSESQRVLNAALPYQISERVKNGEKIADSYSHATVLFADIVGFTNFTKELESRQVVEYSNLIFNKLDKLVKEYKLEKIKVIGDCYMLAGGVQDKSGKRERRASTACDIVEQAQMREIADFAMQILDEAKKINESVDMVDSEVIRNALKVKPVRFRVGLAEGPLTAGVFGTEKVQYDILGATVNLASRLESTGLPEEIQVSPSFYDALEPLGYIFEKRDPVNLKGFGTYQTYFLKGKTQTKMRFP